jgi:hypothetical protein
MMRFVLAIAPDLGNGHALNIAFAVVAGIILIVVAVAVLRRRGQRREFGGTGKWWRGQYAPPDEPLNYQRRDDSGQA